ncbi:MAG TPA: hypothetical protein VGL66_10670 [Caulobacteraceae bacterium]|jgi:hypothetical protein
MTRLVSVSAFAIAFAALAAPAFAGTVPAPLLAAGPAGLAVLAVGGVGYMAVRAYRNHKR